jgi:hypothetical protein
MKRARPHSILNFPARRRVVFAVLAISVSVFSSAHVPARDQDYLNTINEEAENLGKVGNTDLIDSVAEESPDNNSTENSTNKQSEFIQQINSQLYSNGDNESRYLKQLENEVQDLSDSVPQRASAKQNIQNKDSKEPDLTAEQNKVIQITEAQRKEMEMVLETKIPGIYNLYKKLGLTQKQLVVKDYLENEKISTASKTILRLYGGN